MIAGADGGGLIDVSGLTFDEIAAAVSGAELWTALDQVLAGGSSAGYHGFNNHI